MASAPADTSVVKIILISGLTAVLVKALPKAKVTPSYLLAIKSVRLAPTSFLKIGATLICYWAKKPFS